MRLHLDAPQNLFWHLALANWVATSPNNLEHSTLSKRGFKCSDVMPEGPAADPFLASLKFFNNLSTSKSSGTSGQDVIANGFPSNWRSSLLV